MVLRPFLYTTVVIREMLFAHDAAQVTHTMKDMQQLIDRLYHACKEF